jgi:hypothetical protein
MNESSNTKGRYAVGGGVVLCLFIVLCWFAFHEERSPLDQQPAKVEAAKPQARRVAPTFEPTDELSSEVPTNQPNDSASTNAAVIYRQAFALFDALSKEQRIIVSDWHTNVDTSVETELCEKLRPICELMHRASALTNWDWGIDPITVETKLPHLAASRNLTRAALWNAAHCRSNDVTGATDDAVSVLRLGQHISQAAVIGYLVDIAVQSMALSYVTQNLGVFRGTESQRLVEALSDQANQEAPSRAMEQEADKMERLAAYLASLPPDELQKELSQMDDDTPLNLDRTTALAQMKLVVDSDRELAKALASSSEDEYEAWLKHWTDLQASSPLAKMLLVANDRVVDKVRYATVNRAMVVAGLAVAENGPEALAAHPDPASGKPFVYTETDSGFELQSTFATNGTPYKIRFK